MEEWEWVGREEALLSRLKSPTISCFSIPSAASCILPAVRPQYVTSPSHCDATLHASPATRSPVHRLTNGYELQSTALSAQQRAAINISHSRAILFMTPAIGTLLLVELAMALKRSIAPCGTLVQLLSSHHALDL